MWILLLGITFALVESSWASSVQEVKLRSCSYAGVFYIQGKDRYTLDFGEAQKLCEALGTTLANNEQVTAAFDKGFESCRYGWVRSGNITIPRHVSNILCAANLTGVITLVPSETHYDAYCYDKTDTSVKNCTFEIKYVENDPESTDDNATQDLNNTEIPTDVSVTVTPEELLISSTIISVTELTQTIEQMNPNTTSSQNEHDVSGDMLGQNTQPPIATTEVTPGDDDLKAEEGDMATESPDDLGELGGGTEKNVTLLPSLDSTGSGMGETIHTTTSEADTEDSMDTSEGHYTDPQSDIVHPTTTTTEDELVNTDQSVHSRGRMGHDVALPPEENSNNGSTTDWLIILIVIAAIIAIILVAALVVTRKRWCGRSQTLMITSKSSSEGNGTAASAASPEAQEREQEMVTLMNKEKIQENGNTEEFTVITLEESPEKNQQA